MLAALDHAIGLESEAAFAFLERLVRAPSLVGHEQAALEIFAAEAEALGLEVERLPFASGPLADPRAGVAPPADAMSNGRYQVVARTPGEGDLALLLNGHIDVVPAEPAALWTTPPFEPARRDGRLFGRGAGDMKSGFALGMLALRGLRAVAPELFDARRLGFLAVIEEECTGNGTLRSITEHGIRADEVVVLEPTDLGLLSGGVGVMWLEIDVGAAAGHASAAGAEAGAFALGMRLVAALQQWADELRRSEPEPTMSCGQHPYSVNLGTVQAGDWISTVPSGARLGIRMGFPRAWTAEQAEQRLRYVIAAAASRLGLAVQPVVRLTGFRARGYRLETSHPLIEDLAAAHRDAHGAAPATFTLGTTTDARIYVNDFGIPAVCYGARAFRMHGVDESVDLNSIVDGARTLARFILRRFGGGQA